MLVAIDVPLVDAIEVALVNCILHIPDILTLKMHLTRTTIIQIRLFIGNENDRLGWYS